MSEGRGESEEIRREREAERELLQNLAESRDRLSPRCSACGSIGSLEEFEGELRCIDCDEVVAAKTKLEGFGRR